MQQRAVCSSPPPQVAPPTLTRTNKPSPPLAAPTPGSKERFAEPKTEGEIQEARVKGVLKKTPDDTRYCMNECVGCMVQLSPKDVWR